MSDDDRSCPSCGARVPDDAEQCTFCGTSVTSEEPSSGADAPSEASGEESEDPSASAEEDDPDRTSVYCHQCGFENPIEANYCSQCGTELQDLGASEEARPVTADLPEGGPGGDAGAEDAETVSDTEGADPQAEIRSQLLWMIGIGVALVLGFFFVTQWSEQYDWGGTETEAPAPAASESGPSASGPTASGGGPRTSGSAGSSTGGMSNPSGERGAADLEALVSELGSSLEGADTSTIDSLRTEVEGASGSQKQELQAELVQLYTGIGATGRAALVQKQLADATESVEDRRRAADLLYRWMQKVAQQQNRAQSARVARHVASAYNAVVEQKPDDLDARTRMGEAYLLTNNPMKGIRAINGVLEDDSTFVPARFQKGLALLQINRLDEAIRQFEKVKTFAEPGDPFYQQAERAVKVIRERRSDGGGGQGAGS